MNFDGILSEMELVCELVASGDASDQFPESCVFLTALHGPELGDIDAELLSDKLFASLCHFSAMQLAMTSYTPNLLGYVQVADPSRQSVYELATKDVFVVPKAFIPLDRVGPDIGAVNAAPIFLTATEKLGDIQIGCLVIDVAENDLIMAAFVQLWVRMAMRSRALIRVAKSRSEEFFSLFVRVFGKVNIYRKYLLPDGTSILVLDGENTDFNSHCFHFIEVRREPSQSPMLWPRAGDVASLTNGHAFIFSQNNEPSIKDFPVYGNKDPAILNLIKHPIQYPERSYCYNADYILCYEHACFRVPWWVVSFDTKKRNRFLQADNAWVGLRFGNYGGLIEMGAKAADAYVPTRYLPGRYFAMAPIEQPPSHWIMQCYPRLQFLAMLPDDVKLIVDDRLGQYRRDMLEAAGIIADRLALASKDETLQVETLYVPSMKAFNAPVDESSVALYRQVRATMRARGSENAETPSVFYIRRASRQGDDYRRMTNYAAMENILVDRGIPGVELENLTFQQVVELFSNAKLVIGELGAGLYNTVFSDSGVMVLAVSSDAYVHETPLPRICQAHGHELRVVIGHSYDAAANPSHSLWFADPRQIRLAVDECLRDYRR